MNFWNKLSKKTKIEPRKSEFNPNNNWLIVRKLFNPVCGDHFLIQNSTSGKILMKKMIGTDNESTASAMVKSFDFRMKMKSRNILEMKDYDVEVKSELCSQYFYFSVYYAYPEKDLSDLFTERQNDEEDFAHEELLQMFYDVSTGVLNLSRKDARREVGLLQMNKVFWDDESNSFSVVENFLNKKINEIYMTMVLARNPFAILCPEILIRNKKTFEEANRLKVDAFNLGMMILCMGLGIRPGEFYNIKYNQMKSDLLASSIKKFKAKYQENPLLCSILDDLLVEEPVLRMDLKAINEKYPTQDQVSVFLKSNSHVSTDIANSNNKNHRIPNKSLSYNSQSFHRAHSFQNPNLKHSPNGSNSFVNRSHTQRNPYHQKPSLRVQTVNGFGGNRQIKPSNFSNTLPVRGGNHFPFATGNKKMNHQQVLSPQVTPTQPRRKVNRKLMSMGNIQSLQYDPKNANRFQYKFQGDRNSTELNSLLKQGDADFFNS